MITKKRLMRDEMETKTCGECPCGNELTIVVTQCFDCGEHICPGCAIKNDIPFCIYCANDQHCIINIKEIEARCKYENRSPDGTSFIQCDKVGEQTVTCHSQGCGKELKYCKEHTKRCLFSRKPICRNSSDHNDYCVQYKGKVCDFCHSKTFKLSKCVDCDAYACKICKFSVFEKLNIVNAHICKSHGTKCGNLGMKDGCKGVFYPLRSNLCDYKGCTLHCCDCGIYEKSGLILSPILRYACHEHVLVCLRNKTDGSMCMKNYSVQKSYVIRWSYSPREFMCKDCFFVVRRDIENFLLVLKRIYQGTFPRTIFEKILRMQITF